MREILGSILRSDLQLFFFFNLGGKNSLIVKNFYASRKWQRPFMKGKRASAISKPRKVVGQDVGLSLLVL